MPSDAPFPKFGPPCPFCQAAWSDDNVRLSDLDCTGYESADPYGADATLTLVCHACGREMYRKEDLPVRWSPWLDLPEASPEPNDAQGDADRPDQDGRPSRLRLV